MAGGILATYETLFPYSSSKHGDRQRDCQRDRREQMPYVRTIPYEESQGELTEAYDIMIKTRGRIANVQAVAASSPTS